MKELIKPQEIAEQNLFMNVNCSEETINCQDETCHCKKKSNDSIESEEIIF